MKRPLLFGMALLLAIATIAVGLLVWTQRGNSTRLMSAPNAAAELRRMLDASNPASLAATSAERTALAIARSEPNADWWQRPLSEVFSLMQAAAEAGDKQAAYALGSRSAWCMKVLRERTPETLLSEYRQNMESIEVADDPALTRTRLTNTNNRFQRELDSYEDCAVLGEERVSGYLSWLERAGRAGVTGARLAYVQYAMSEYRGDRGALIAEIEVASDRRTQARDWLEQMVRDGNEQALATYVEALSGHDGLYTKDLAKATTYAYTLDLVRSRRMAGLSRVDRFPQLWTEGPIRYGDRLKPHQWDEITVRGRHIFQESFEHPPPVPNR